MVEGRRDQVGSAGPGRFKMEVTSEIAPVGTVMLSSKVEIVYAEPLFSPKYFYNQDDNYILGSDEGVSQHMET